MSGDFVKISELSTADRGKLREYWKELWGKEFADALVTDFEPQGDKIKVQAKNHIEKLVRVASKDVANV